MTVGKLTYICGHTHVELKDEPSIFPGEELHKIFHMTWFREIFGSTNNLQIGKIYNLKMRYCYTKEEKDNIDNNPIGTP